MNVHRRIGLSALLSLLLLVFLPATAGASQLPVTDEESGGGGVSYPCWETAWAEPGDPGDGADGSGGDSGEEGSPEGEGETTAGEVDGGQPEQVMVCYAPGTPVDDGGGTDTDTGGGGWAGGGPTSGPDESGGSESESGPGDVEGEDDSLDPDSAEAHELEDGDAGCEGGGGDSGGVLAPDMPIDSGPADVGGDPDEPVSSSALEAAPPCAEVTSVSDGDVAGDADSNLLGALPTRIDAGAGALAATGAPAAGLLAGAAALSLAVGRALRRRRRR